MRIQTLMTAMAVSAVLAPSIARADPVDDLRNRLDKLEVENADLRARLRKLEAENTRSDMPSPPVPVDGHAIDGGVSQTVANQAFPSQQLGWTGLYLGLSAGPELTRSNGYFLGVNPTLSKLAGTTVGVGLGGDIQLGRVVVGAKIEAGYDGVSGIETATGTGSAAASCLTGPSVSTYLAGTAQKQISCRAFEGLTGEFTGRIGYTFLHNRLLTYVRGGVVASRLSINHTFTVFPYPGEPFPSVENGHGSKTLAGISIGTGAEYQISRLISLEAEYRLREYDAKSLYENYQYNIAQGPNLVTGSQIIGPQSHDRYDSLLRFSINFYISP